MRRLPRALLLLPVALIGACATRAVHSPSATLTAPADASSYGLFLAGQAAVNSGRGDAAAGLFEQAVGHEAGDPSFLHLRAFTAALLAGQVERAAQLAPQGAGAEAPLRHIGALVRGVDALARGDGRQARAILTGPDADPAHEVGAALVAPWAAAAAGDVEASIARPTIADDPVSQFYADLGQGRLFERAGRFGEAETTYRALIAKGDPGGLASLNLGAMLERRGRAAEASAIYASALQRNAADPALTAARARSVAKGVAPRPPSLREGAAEALVAPASVLVARKQPEIGLAYLRLVLRLDPARDDAWLMVGDIVGVAGDAIGARAAYASVSPHAPQYVAAREKLAWSQQTAGDSGAALKTARDTVAAEPSSDEAAVTLADILRANNRYGESVAILDPLIAAKGDKVDWRLLYMRAIDLQESGRWPEAERDLQAALKQQPNEPELLNFLGFSWIDRGENLPLALSMVKKAVDLDPTSGAMLDSLGWGYFRTGAYLTAVEKLEAAVELEPADPDVNDHLGDAYWRVGRKTEAQFQWRRVLTLEPSAKLRGDVESKLKTGLATAPSVVAGG